MLMKRRKAMLPVALQLYSVRDEAERDLEKTLRAVHEMGYDGVETAGLYGKTAGELKALFEKYSLTPISAHVGLGEFEGDMEGLCAAYAELGCKNLSIPHIDASCLPTRGGFAEFKKKLTEIAKELDKYGITLSYHNHDFEFEKADGKYLLDLLYKEVDEKILKTQIDVCWAAVGGVNPADYLLSYSGRCPTVHLKDYRGVKGENMYAFIDDEKKDAAGRDSEEFEFRPCGYGKQNFPEIISAAEKAGAKWLIVEQDRPSMGKTSLECAKMSIDYLKEI